MSELCFKNTLRFSVDNKNKIDVGIPAVNRRSKLRTFHLTSDAPNYNDHDYPNPNCKLVPAGYQVLKERKTRSNSLSPPRMPLNLKTRRRSFSESTINDLVKKTNLCSDKIGRNKISWSRNGPLHVRLYPARAVESTNVMHVNFLVNFLKNNNKLGDVHNVVAIADGGPDWSVKGVINLLSLGYLWENAKLDVLVLQSYAPGHSRFNPIERSWSQLTKWLVGVLLPDNIDGKKPSENDTVGWNKILDDAVDMCSKFWDGKEYAGFPVSVEKMYTGSQVINKLKEVHQLIHSFVNTTKKGLSASIDLQSLQKKYKFYVKHCNRKPYQIEFAKCDDNQCSHCLSLPNCCNDMLNMMKLFGGSFPVPEESVLYPGHYRTFLDLLQSSTLFNQATGKYLPKRISDKFFGVCPFDSCNYTFFSKADIKRHYLLMGHLNKNQMRRNYSKNKK